MNYLPRVILLSVLFLVQLGLLLVHGLAENPAWNVSGAAHPSGSLLLRQAVAALAGAGLMFLAGRADLRVVRRLVLPFSLMVLVLLVLLLVPGIGYRIRGTCRLLPLGPFMIQPSEWTRLALPLFLAWWFDRRGADDPRPAIPLVAIGLTILLIGYQPDFTAALLVALAGLALLAHARVSRTLLATVAVAGFCALSIHLLSDPATCRRILAWSGRYGEVRALGPWQEALRDAGWCGIGLGNSAAVAWYDGDAPRELMTAVLGEELGWIGLLGVTTAYGTLLASGLGLARKAEDHFGYLLGLGIVWMLGLQILLNAMGMLGLTLWRVPGLPLISVSTSGLLVDLLSVGLLLGLGRRTHRAIHDGL